MIYTELNRKKRETISQDLCSWEGLEGKGDNMDGDMSWGVGDSRHISSPRAQQREYEPPFAVWRAVGLTEGLWGVWIPHVRSVHMPLAPKAVQ